jgi:hypothetical protein
MSTHRAKILAGVLTVAATVPPAASARPIRDRPATTPPVVTRVTDQGFDVDSAAIGAGGAFLVLTAAGVAAVGGRRHRLGVAR